MPSAVGEQYSVVFMLLAVVTPHCDSMRFLDTANPPKRDLIVEVRDRIRVGHGAC